ncbi:MAG: tRNA 4-thiouridine(8) synthase ThiI [Kiritimatiellae bacterium]|nr:tRNA 4-thiouridine(8) synthase ThiI [Kiritimatiellia bacterium]
MKARGLSLLSGGLDSQLAVRVLERAGAYVEGVTFSTPFFDCAAAKKAASALGVKLHVVDFTADEIELVKAPPHGFGGAMNPCIDCHATMIRRAGEMMAAFGFDFVATGEVMGQRPMSQNKQALGVVEKSSGLKGRLVRPLSAKLLEPTIPEQEGLLDREALLDISGRQRERQIKLAAELGIVDYPSPAGGCKLTEEGFGRKLKDLRDHEGLDNRELVELLLVARRFRLPGGAGVILGRDQHENAILKDKSHLGVLVAPVNCPGPTAIVTAAGELASSDLELAKALVAAYSRSDRLPGNVVLTAGEVPRPYSREPFKQYQLC